MLETIKAWVDGIFSPILSFLDMAMEQLRAAQLVTAQGLNVGQYFRVFGDLPRPFQAVITSIMVSVVVIGGVFFFRSIARIYFSIKEGVHWW